MEFKPANFAAFGPAPVQKSGLESFLDSLTSGADLGFRFSEMQRRNQSQDLIDALTKAKTEDELRKASKPFGGEIAPGDVGQAQWLQLLGDKYGTDSKVYKNAEKTFNLNLLSKQGLIDYRGNLSNTMDKRAATNLGKIASEMDEIKQGFSPGSGGKILLSPDDQNKLLDQYNLKLQKEVSDNATRQKSLYATNIDKTFGLIDPKNLTQFSGVSGQSNLKKEQIQSALGHPSDNFINYNKSLVAANTLAKQVRQFYGDSITPGIQEKLSLLTNPTSWINDPKVAIENFNAFKDLMGKETSTYRGALKSTKEFEGKIPENSSGSTTLYRNGKSYNIPNADVNEALKEGGFSRGR